MSVETGAEEEVLMSRMHLDQLQELRQQSVESKKRLKVVVEFAPFYFSSRTELGQEDREYAEDGDSYKAQKYVDVLEWMYAPSKSRVSKKSGKPNKLIYVCCCNFTNGDVLSHAGTEGILSYAYSLKQRWSNNALMEKVEFAIRQLKEYLESVENTDDFKYHYNCGSVKLYVSAYHPVDILLFAFQKALGFSVEKNIKSEGLALQNDKIKEDEVFNKELYGDFIDRVKNNANIQYMARWIKEHHWTLHLEDCEVHQIYNMSGVFFTEQGKYKNRKKEITKLMNELDEPTMEFINAHIKGSGVFTDDFTLYESCKRAWKENNNLTIYEERYADVRNERKEKIYSTCFKMEFPAMEYDGKLYSYYGLRDLLIEETDKLRKKNEKANNRSALEKQAKAQLEEIDKEEKAFNTRTNKQMEEIEGKKATLQKRRVEGSPEREAWVKSYAGSHASLDDTKDAVNDYEVIEYQGESLNEIELTKKQIEILHKQMAQSKKFCDRRLKALDLLKQLEKVNWDLKLTGLQVLVGLACMVLSVVLPPVGVFVATVVCSSASIFFEWKKIQNDDHAGENWKDHTFSILLDVVSMTLVPLLGVFISRSAKLIQATHTAGSALKAGEVGKTTAKGAKAGKVAGEAGSAAGEATTKGGNVGKAEGVVEDVVITQREILEASGKAGDAATAGGDAGKVGQTTGDAATVAGDTGKGEGFLDDTIKGFSKDADTFSQETKAIIDQPVDLSKSREARHLAVNELERRIFEIYPDEFKELVAIKTGNPESYFARVARIQKIAQEGKYSNLFNKGFTEGVNFTGKDLFTGHIGRLLKFFGFKEVANLLKTKGMLGIHLPKGLSFRYIAYILLNGASIVDNIVDGFNCVIDRELNSEYAADLDQSALSETRDRIMSENE